MTRRKANKDMDQEDFVFTIMPFGGWFDDYYKSIYAPAINDSGLISRRGDDLYRPSTIINDIWLYIKESKLVIADLTGKNPNVLYELGLAHAVAKPGIIITQNLDDIPFDLRSLRIIEYDKNSPDWGEILKVKISKSINEVLNSPMESVLPTFLNIEDLEKNIKRSYEKKEAMNLYQEMEGVKEGLIKMKEK